MFELTVQEYFSAAHYLQGYNGPCANVHGHNYSVSVCVRCPELNETGLGIDFKLLKAGLRKVLSSLDHTNLNEHPAFRDCPPAQNPSSENIAKYIFGAMQSELSAVVLKSVTVAETEGSSVTYYPE